MIGGCGCGFMQRTRGEAGNEGRVERRKAVRGPLLKLKGPSTEVSLGTGRVRPKHGYNRRYQREDSSIKL